MTKLITEHPILIRCAALAALGLLAWALTRINHQVFQRIKNKQKGLHLLFFERVNTALILIGAVILALSVFVGGLGAIWKTVLGGTAIVSAVLAFAAQDVIKDVLAGMMISLYKPFEVGNRIVLEDGTAGIVKDITMRHVVLGLLDTQMLVIPNSKLNAMSIRNFSYHASDRSALFTFQIAYGSDVEKAMRVIREAIISSPYSKPGGAGAQEGDHASSSSADTARTAGEAGYGPVYFMAYEDSSLRLQTTVYYEAVYHSEVVISDINLRVSHALEENGIEIPYAYINVIQKQ